MDCIVTFKTPDVHRAITKMLEIIHSAWDVRHALSDHLSAYCYFLFKFALAEAISKDSARLLDISQEKLEAYHDIVESVVDKFLF
jgi:hypothetical protein